MDGGSPTECFFSLDSPLTLGPGESVTPEEKNLLNPKRLFSTQTLRIFPPFIPFFSLFLSLKNLLVFSKNASSDYKHGLLLEPLPSFLNKPGNIIHSFVFS